MIISKLVGSITLKFILFYRK